ncbi:Tryptophan/tyrosine permease family-domain-containing protein [Haematococcus lacustris]
MARGCRGFSYCAAPAPAALQGHTYLDTLVTRQPSPAQLRLRSRWRQTAPCTPQALPQASSRLFSRLDPEGRHAPGSLLGCSLLVAGTTPAGFLASAAALVGCCAYSVITGLLVAEVNLNIMREQGAGGVSLVTMAQATLGQRAASVVSVLYIFQHYSLLVAYISRSGEILSQDTGLPSPLACTLFAVPLGLACYALPGRQLDALNNSLVAGVVAVFMALVLLVLPGVQPDTLWVANWGAVPHTLPVMALAVPVVVKELEGDPGKIRASLLCGSLLPLAMFLVWEAVVLGSMGPAAATTAAAAAVAGDPLAALQASSPVARPLVDSFSLLAIVTSFIGFCLGLTDFLEDILSPRTRQPPPSLSQPGPTPATSASNSSSRSAGGTGGSGRQSGSTVSSGTGSSSEVAEEGRSAIGDMKVWQPGPWRLALATMPMRQLTYALTVLPPLLMACTFPQLFYAALDLAGTYGVMTLFGLLPAAMAWSQRLPGSQSRPATHTRLMAGGNAVLIGVGAIALAVIFNEVVG